MIAHLPLKPCDARACIGADSEALIPETSDDHLPLRPWIVGIPKGADLCAGHVDPAGQLDAEQVEQSRNVASLQADGILRPLGNRAPGFIVTSFRLRSADSLFGRRAK